MKIQNLKTSIQDLMLWHMLVTFNLIIYASEESTVISSYVNVVSGVWLCEEASSSANLLMNKPDL